MSVKFGLEADAAERIFEKVQQFTDGGVAEQVINNYFHNEGATLIKQEIIPLIHRSGRDKSRWKNKATLTDIGQFKQDDTNISVTVAARGNYGYLYFPDDGSNTLHHVGDQQFMLRGAENAAPQIIDETIKRLIQRLEG